MDVDDPELRRWIEIHRARVAELDVVQRFHEHLLTMRWAGAGIDWRELPHRTLHLDHPSDEDVLMWLRGTVLGRYEELLVIDAANEPGVIAPFAAVRDLDGLSNRPEIFVCGVLTNGAQTHVIPAHFAERRSFNQLTVVDPIDAPSAS